MESAGRSKVFISYSRADLGFADELVAALGMAAEFEILFDRIGIGHGEEWRGRLGRLIVESDTVVFILSPDSVASEVCAWEVEEARRLSKRIIPVLWRAVDFARVPAGLSAINAVPFDGERAVSGLPKLITALNSDLAWLREHTRLGERAADWEESGRASAYLLRGAALGAVRDWLAARPANAPETTELQRVFIQASEEEESRLLGEDRKRLEELEKAKAIAEAERELGRDGPREGSGRVAPRRPRHHGRLRRRPDPASRRRRWPAGSPIRTPRTSARKPSARTRPPGARNGKRRGPRRPPPTPRRSATPPF